MDVVFFYEQASTVWLLQTPTALSDNLKRSKFSFCCWDCRFVGHSFSWGPILCIGQCGRSNTTNQQSCPQNKTTFLHLLWLFQFHVELPTSEIFLFHGFLLNFIGNFNYINACVKLTKRMKLRVVRIHLVFIVWLLMIFFNENKNIL